MALLLGTRLGPYEIVSALGAGGMGEVYRARDTTLHRDVAIKVLPDLFASDAERLARFTREAQTLAALNHPNIAHIHGLEQSGGVRALVLELVEGEDLAQRIARGAIPLDEALPIARQIAEALEAAHEQGIIHRDLKPANIKVRPDGTVKVLDFGLAKAMEPAGGALNVSHSPTLTSPAMMTGMGVILGTAAYMSPEQARGTTADRRADLWAFGVVLWEMLTAQRPFEQPTVQDTLASVLKTEPDWNALPVTTPAAIRLLLRQCLEKERKRRLDSAAAARLDIEEGMTPSVYDGAAAPIAPAPRSMWLRALPWAVATVLGVAALLVWAPWSPAARSRVTRTTITTSGSATLTINGTDLALTPDSAHLVYVGNKGTQLFVRALDALDPVAIAGGTPRGPFVSPDGSWVGFVDDVTTIKKVAITGGPPSTVASIDGTGPRGATWAPDDTIIFATNNPATGLQRVSAAGGTPEVLTSPDSARGEADHLWPEILPGGRAVLFTITAQAGGLDAALIAVRDLRTGTQQILVRGGSDAHYVASGHLVYTAAGTLRAVAFDLNRLEAGETTVPVVPRLVTTNSGAGDFAVATDGMLVYVDAPAGLTGTARTLVWVDRAGQEEPIAAPPRAYAYPQLSPDGTRVALDIRDQEQDLWILDLRRGSLTPLTFEPGLDSNPMWTPDGKRIIFSSDRAGGQMNLWRQTVDSTGEVERLTTSSNSQFTTGIAPDGTEVVFAENTLTMGRDLLRLALDGSRRVTPLLQTKLDDQGGTVSPDGRWLAYASNGSGQSEIYVRPFLHAGRQSLVSAGGGTAPLWSRNGKELFYLGLDGALLRVGVEATGDTWNAGTATKLLEARYFTVGSLAAGRPYDVSPDGQRFLMIHAAGADATASPPSIIVIQHWLEELKRLVPTK